MEEIIMKPYMNEGELINELVINKKIRRETIPEEIFKERAYTMLVSPYKRLICLNRHPITKKYLYKENGDFWEYINLAKIDDFISNKFSLYIECFEKYFKTYVGEKLADKLRKTNQNCNDYSIINSYLDSIPSYMELQHMSISEINHLEFDTLCYDLLPFHLMYDKKMKFIHADKNILLNRRRAFDNLISLNKNRGKSNNVLVQHYFNNGIVPPIWAIIHTLSLGDIMAIFNTFSRKDRVEITKKMMQKDKVKAIQIGKLSAKINTIREIRNTINHYEPLIPFLMKYKDNNQENLILSILKMLKTFYQDSTILGVKVIKRKAFIKLSKNDFNKKYIIYTNKIIREI